MPIGTRSHVGLKKETTWGSAVTVDKFLPFISESITPDIEEIVSAAQRAIVDEPPSYLGEKRFGGDIVMNVHPASIGHILRSALGAPAAASASGTAEVELEDCEDAWVGDGGVISGVDASDYKKGTKSIKLQVTADVAGDDILATEIVSETDMTSDTHIKFWIKSSVVCDSGDLIFMFSETASCGGAPKSLNIGALSAGVWSEQTLVLTDMAAFNQVISVGIKMHTDKGECTINLDDVRRVVTSAASNAKDHVFTPVQTDFHALCTLPPYTIEVFRDQANDKAWQYKGSVVNTLALNFGTDDKIMKATAGIIAKEEAEIDKEAVSLESTDPFIWNQSAITIATVDHDYLENFSLNIDNHLIGVTSLNESRYIRKIVRDAARTMNFSFVTDFVDKTEYDKFIAGTEQAFQIKFEGAECESGYKYTIQIDIPKMRYLAYPINVGGPERLTVGVSGKAKYCTSADYAVRITLINLETSY